MSQIKTKKGEWTAAARTAISAARRLRLVRVRMGVERPPLLLCDAGGRAESGHFRRGRQKRQNRIIAAPCETAPARGHLGWRN